MIKNFNNEEFSQIGKMLFTSNINIKEYYNDEREHFRLLPMYKISTFTSFEKAGESIIEAKAQIELETSLYEQGNSSLFQSFLDHLGYFCFCEEGREQFDDVVKQVSKAKEDSEGEIDIENYCFELFQEKAAFLNIDASFDWGKVLLVNYSRGYIPEYYKYFKTFEPKDMQTIKEEIETNNCFTDKRKIKGYSLLVDHLHDRIKNHLKLDVINSSEIKEIILKLIKKKYVVGLASLSKPQKVHFFDSCSVFLCKLIESEHLHPNFYLFSKEKFKNVLLHLLSKTWTFSERHHKKGTFFK